jgi:acyl-CoA synthetase (AMP-forming)/AMP-acid ligase II
MVFTSPYPPVSIRQDMSITDYVFEKCNPNSIALIDGVTEQTLTYNELQQMVHTVANNLYHNYHLRKGQVVAIMLPNMPLYSVFILGIAHIGGVFTTMNPAFTVDEIYYQLKDCKARMIITVPSVLEKLNNIDGVDHIFVVNNDGASVENLEPRVPILDAHSKLLMSNNNEQVHVTIDPKQDLLCLPYSSGTTGQSKAVMVTHYSVIMNMEQTNVARQYSDIHHEIILATIPMFHLFGMLCVGLHPIRKGSTVITMPRFNFIQMLSLIEKYKINYIPCVPPILSAMVNSPSVSQYDLSSLKYIGVGAASLSSELAKKVVQKFSVKLKNSLGMTEAGPLLCLSNSCETENTEIVSVGVLLPNTELKVIDVDTENELEEEGKIGLLCFRGPQIMKGYLNNEYATNSTIRDGWLYSGDIGYYLNGCIHLTDRQKDIIKYNGYQVSPSELESVIMKHPMVLDVVVVGEVDEVVGEIPKAFVVVKPNMSVTPDDIISHVRDRLVHYKQVRRVQFCNALDIPKTPSGKILRRLLRSTQPQKCNA